MAAKTKRRKQREAYEARLIDEGIASGISPLTQLVRCARADLERGDVAEALDSLRKALTPAESSAMRIRWAIEKLEELSAEPDAQGA